MSSSPPVLVVGAGPAGLACARHLASRGREVQVLEAGDRVGGRLGSRTVDGVVCDLGFQVSMSNYEALESLVPRNAFPRHSFIPGALVVTPDDRIRVVDPGREPFAGLRAWRRGLVGFSDLRAALRLRRAAGRVAGDEPGVAIDVITRCGFSRNLTESFLRPFFGGVFLDESLAVPASRFLRTVHRFAHGVAELPEGGMQRLADGMAGPILDRIRLESPVARVEAHGVHLADGTRVEAETVVLATPIDITATLLDQPLPDPNEAWRATHSVHFTTDRPVMTESIIALNGRGTGDVNLVTSPTAVAPGYADDDRHVVVASLRPTGATTHSAEVDVDAIAAEAADLLGTDSRSWRHVETTSVRHALPRPGVAPRFDLPSQGIRVVGDWMDDPSIENSVRLGTKVADDLTRGAA